MPTLYSKPSITGSMRESPLYRTMGVNNTDRVFLLAHADGLPLNDPVLVLDVQDAINTLQANENSPLLRALVETFNAGSQDIWIVATAPMAEWLPPESRDHSYYVQYASRLQATYDLLSVWDAPQIVVPVDAPMCGAFGVDFLTPLVNHCQISFETTGAVRIGVIGSRGPYTDTDITAIANDSRLLNLGDGGKFVLTVIGEGMFNFNDISVTYNAPLAASLAGELASLDLDTSITMHKFAAVQHPTTIFTDAQISRLSEAKLNAIGRTSRGERGNSFETVICTDNTLGITGTDYWSLSQVRLVMHVIEKVRTIGNAFIGSVSYGEFKRQLRDYFVALVRKNLIRDFSLDVSRNDYDPKRVIVDLTVQPYFGLRQIGVAIEVGPGSVA